MQIYYGMKAGAGCKRFLIFRPTEFMLHRVLSAEQFRDKPQLSAGRDRITRLQYIANMLDAESVIFWKDVPGVLNADPKWLPDAKRLEEMSYKEAVEMTFSGAKVIHPKTIKPLHNKNIPLHVRSFVKPSDDGTIIKSDPAARKLMPVFIKKEDQILISILPKDFSFVMGDNLSRIFHSFTLHGIKVNLVEASAVSLDVCLDDERIKVDALIDDLKSEFSAVYNEKVEMLSVTALYP